MTNAFVGHSYHQVTASSAWFIDLLNQHSPVKLFWDSQWSGGKRLEKDELLDCDRIFVWQVEHLARELAEIVPHKVVFIPMWDGVLGLRESFWHAFGQVRILSFSWALHERLRKLGLNSFHSQYFPHPSGFHQVTDFSTLRGYLWQRRPEIGWPQIAALSGGQKWDRFQFHAGMDPTYGEIEPPSRAQMRRNNIQVTRFSRDPIPAALSVDEANIYFSSRLSEGIGMAFLEAMARGQCVVSPDAATMSEYMENRVNGLLYNPARLEPLDFSQAARIGAAARRRIEHGFEDWAFDRDHRLPEILFPDSSGIAPPRTRFQAEWSRSPLTNALRAKSKHPKVTVAIVTLNAADSFEETLACVCEQTFGDIEIVVVDGGSTDGTVDLIRDHRDVIDAYISEADKGPYDAMNKAAHLGTGEFIVYMNAGDFFATRDSIARALGTAPADADFIFGHHVYLHAERREEFHHAAHFDETWQQLTNGNLTWRWLAGVPCHQATFTRREMLLTEGGYSAEFKIAADHEFMYRMRQRGAKFHNSGETLAIYSGGGFSYQRQRECAQDWWRIARHYGDRKNVDRFFRANFPVPYEIGPWTPDVIGRYVARRIGSGVKPVKHAIRRLNRIRSSLRRRYFPSRRRATT